MLGEDFAISAGKLFDALNEIRSKAVMHLSGIPLDELLAGFTDRGLPKTPEQQAWCSQQREGFIARVRRLSLWQLALVEPDRTSAKYDYWSKAAYFSLEELLWLSVGLEPLPEFSRALATSSRAAHQRDAVALHMVAQRELFRRSFDPNGYERRQTAQTVLDWANLVQHELHPGFRRMLETMVQREASPNLALAPTAEPLEARRLERLNSMWHRQEASQIKNGWTQGSALGWPSFSLLSRSNSSDTILPVSGARSPSSLRTLPLDSVWKSRTTQS